jgi:hypothetical protein
MNENNTPSLMYLESQQGNLVSLYDAIGKASASFPDLPRTATGQVGKDRKFQYAPFHKVVRCIKPALAENGVGFVQPIHTETEGTVSITLLVFGHGGTIASTLKFKQNSDPKIFGADCTYHKRYQLTSFFGLEGDPDADDFDDSVVENKTVVSKPVQTQPKGTNDSKSVPLETKQETAVSNGETKNQDISPAQTDTNPKASVEKDTRPISAKLTDAMKQLVWKMEDFDKFCKEHSEEFPGFLSASKLAPEGKQKLYDLLVLHKGVAPF